MTARPPPKRAPPPEPDEEDVVLLDDESDVEDLADEPTLVVGRSMIPPEDPDYLLLTGQADPDVDNMVEDAFAKNTVPTDPVPAADSDPDEAEFRAFMESIAKHKLPKP